MKNIIRNYIRFAVKRHKLVVGISIILLVLALLVASNIAIDSSMEGLLPKGNPVFEAAERMEAEFGAQDEIMVAIVCDGTEEIASDFMRVLASRIEKKNLAANILYRLEVGGHTTYFVSESGNMYLMTIAPNINLENFIDDRDLFFVGMQMAIDETLSLPEFGGLDVGMTGGIFILDYEADQVMMDGFIFTAIFTLVIVMGLFALSFKRLLLPLTTILPLTLAVALSTAFAATVFESINFFSMFSMVILLGLGLDFAIHILARYGEERSKGNLLEDSLVATLEKTGMAMIIGTTTTMATFLAFLFAQVRAFEQVGIISAVGIFLAMICQFAVTPALIAWADHKKEEAKRTDMVYNFMRPVGRFCVKCKMVITVLILLLMGLLFTNVMNIPVSGDVTTIYPEDLPSLTWLDKVQNEFDFNPDEITIMAESLGEMEYFIRHLEASPLIASVESIVEFLPQERELWEHALPLLPAVITERFVGNTGNFLLRVRAYGDIWDSEVMGVVRAELTSLTPNIGGMALLMDEIVSLAVEDAVLCSAIASVAIFIMLLIMFRSFKHSVLALLPVAIAVYLLLGILPLIGAEITIAGGLAIPLVIGLGISGAVHITHRIKESKNIPESLVHTGKAVIVSEVTNLVAFGSLMVFSGHPALSDLGRIVAIGLGLCLALNLVLLPAILGFVRKLSNITPK